MPSDLTSNKAKTTSSASRPVFLFSLNSLLSPFETHSNLDKPGPPRSSPPNQAELLHASGSTTTSAKFCPSQGFLPNYTRQSLYIRSFSIGEASIASRQGISDHIFKILCRWCSWAYHSYIHLIDIQRAHSHLVQ